MVDEAMTKCVLHSVYHDCKMTNSTDIVQVMNLVAVF